MMNQKSQVLVNALLVAIAGLGDVFTDAPECAAAVSAARNLSLLAGKLSLESPSTTEAFLWADGQCLGTVDVFIDGSIKVHGLPEGFDTSGCEWSIQATSANGGIDATFVVDMHTGECADDETWCIADSSIVTFYNMLLSIAA